MKQFINKKIFFFFPQPIAQMKKEIEAERKEKERKERERR